MKINNDQRKRLVVALKKFYAKYPHENYNILQFVKSFKDRHKKNKQTYLGVAGEAGCLLHSTKLLGYNKTLKELYNENKSSYISTISMLRNGEIVPSLSRIIKSGKKKLYKVKLFNGKEVIASEDHIFFTEDFKEIKVKDIKKGIKLIQK